MANTLTKQTALDTTSGVEASKNRVTFSNLGRRHLFLFLTHCVTRHCTLLELIVGYYLIQRIPIHFGALLIEILASHYQHQTKLALGPIIFKLVENKLEFGIPGNLEKLSRVFGNANLSNSIAQLDKQEEIIRKRAETRRSRSIERSRAESERQGQNVTDTGASRQPVDQPQTPQSLLQGDTDQFRHPPPSPVPSLHSTRSSAQGPSRGKAMAGAAAILDAIRTLGDQILSHFEEIHGQIGELTQAVLPLQQQVQGAAPLQNDNQPRHEEGLHEEEPHHQPTSPTFEATFADFSLPD